MPRPRACVTSSANQRSRWKRPPGQPRGGRCGVGSRRRVRITQDEGGRSAGLRGTGCRMQGVGCRLKGAGCGLRAAGCGVQDAGCGVQEAGCGLRGTGCRLQGAGCGLQAAGCGVLARELGPRSAPHHPRPAVKRVAAGLGAWRAHGGDSCGAGSGRRSELALAGH